MLLDAFIVILLVRVLVVVVVVVVVVILVVTGVRQSQLLDFKSWSRSGV